MKKQNLILSAALAAVFSSSVVFAEAEVTGKIVHESATFTKSGIGIGAATTSTQTANSHGKDVFKTATHAKIFIDGDAEELTEGATYHVELNAFNDGKGIGDYDGNESYTQRDALREAYVDAEVNDYSLRVGKQQVVWGTADGMKLLDAINPTDYSEMAQNQMEDSRIPVWMLNAETDAADGGNWQFILSEGKSSHFAGMGQSSGVKRQVALDNTEATVINTEHTNGSQGHAFKMKGADTITGQVNGFLNIVPALGAVSDAFRLAGNAKTNHSASVNDFIAAVNAGGTDQASTFAPICNTVESLATNAACMEAITNTHKTAAVASYKGANNKNKQNLFSDTTIAAWNSGKANPTQVFHYMPDATFATFDQFVGAGSKFVVDHDERPTLSARYKNSTADGLNYSLNVINGNDTNPYVALHWEDQAGNVLAETAQNNGVYYTNNLGDGTTVGGSAGGAGGTAATTATFVMTEKLNPITQVGGSFDTAIETVQFGPIVLRGEGLYQKGVMSPVVTRKDSTGKDLNHGFLASSLTMTEGDRFKYVLGADITVMTNMMVSTQFIQDIDLDYVDIGNKDANNWKYTADMATMSLTNNLNKGKEYKEFYSLFLSKPFGASGEHRWNNIFMFEDGNGKWNRLDAEFSIDDDTQVTAEYNKYWGDANTQFGQLEKSSNIQVGVKYSF